MQWLCRAQVLDLATHRVWPSTDSRACCRLTQSLQLLKLLDAVHQLVHCQAGNKRLLMDGLRVLKHLRGCCLR